MPLPGSSRFALTMPAEVVGDDRDFEFIGKLLRALAVPVIDQRAKHNVAHLGKNARVLLATEARTYDGRFCRHEADPEGRDECGGLQLKPSFSSSAAC